MSCYKRTCLLAYFFTYRAQRHTRSRASGGWPRTKMTAPLRENLCPTQSSRRWFAEMGPLRRRNYREETLWLVMIHVALINCDCYVFTRRLSVCLSLCMSVWLLATSHKNYWLDLHENFTRDLSVNWLNFGSYSHLDLDPGIFKSIFNIARSGVFSQFGSYYPTRCSAIAERPRCKVRYSFRQK